MMQQHGVLGFRWYPHAATGTVLLKVHFVSGPQVHLVISHQYLEFFFAPSAVRDPPEQWQGAVCAAESPTAGTNADTAARPRSEERRVGKEGRAQGEWQTQ